MANLFQSLQVTSFATSFEKLVKQGADLDRAYPARDAFAAALIDTEVHEKACELGHGSGRVGDD